MSEAVVVRKNPSVLIEFAARYKMDPAKVMSTLKATAFRQRTGPEVSDEQMQVLLIVADQHGLNPFTKEIFAYPDKQNGIVPVVSVDGWSRIINEHNQLDGIDFRWSETMVTPKGGKPCPEWCESIITRKDRARPIVIREYLDEVYRESDYASPWKSHTKRMLRHKALIQGARIAFGFSGIYDQDEAERIVEYDVTPTAPDRQQVEGPKKRAEPEQAKAEPEAHTQDAPAAPDLEGARQVVIAGGDSIGTHKGDVTLKDVIDMGPAGLFIVMEFTDSQIVVEKQKPIEGGGAAQPAETKAEPPVMITAPAMKSINKALAKAGYTHEDDSPDATVLLDLYKLKALSDMPMSRVNGALEWLAENTKE